MLHSRLATFRMTRIEDDCDIIWSRKEKSCLLNENFPFKANHADVELGTPRDRHLTPTHVCLFGESPCSALEGR